MRFSTPVRNAMLDAIETVLGAGGSLRVYTGALPASPAAARTGTLLATVTLPSDSMGNASGGVKAMQGTWNGTASANGMAGYFSVMDAAGTTCHIDGYIGQNWAQSTTYALNQQCVANGNVYKITTAGTSSGSGTGPSGTGGSIADGTATWAYVGAADMTIDNGSLANGQAVAATAFQFTAPNP